MNKKKLISIIIPVYNEEKNIPLISKEIKKIFSNLKYNYEIIMVNDGSKDGSILEIKKLAENNKKIKGIDFSRNFGKEVATSAGCHCAKGDAAIIMDADLQHPPELIPRLIKKWEKGAEMVYTVRKESRGSSVFKKTTSFLYWWLLGKISSVQSEPHSTDFRLLDKKILKEFKHFPERGRIFRGIIDWMGFKRDRIEFIAPERENGVATYDYRKLFGLAINSLTAFSLLPLRIAGYLGILITFLSGILIIVMFITRWFLDSTTFSSLSFVVVSNIALSGIMLISLGFIALYIARIHDEVVDRPLYIIRNKINF